MDFRLIRLADTQQLRWKNGAGAARSIWREGDVASPDWELAVAEMTGTQPFSSYPGVDRSLFVTEGALVIRSEVRDVTLTPLSEGLEFPGEEVITGTSPGEGVMLDFNILTRRSVCRHSAVRRLGGQGTELSVAGGWTVVHAALGTVCVSAGEDVTLHQGDTLILRGSADTPKTVKLRIGSGSAAITAEILPR
ncbi:HutD/Ves family protein [Falsigemmobacter faecalis]|nr:HutD family protein [Falsigemmobacter faecalis]